MTAHNLREKYDSRNLSMLFDFYEMTMGNGYFKQGMKDKIVIFDLFFRRIPDDGGFAIICGLEQVVQYIENLHFTEDPGSTPAAGSNRSALPTPAHARGRC